MFKFAHLADIHLGANHHPVLEALETQLFMDAMDKCIEANVDFILICGDLFHIGIPDMTVVKRCAQKLNEIQQHGIPIYVIFGSHDYNPNTDSIVNVLESAGLIHNIVQGIALDNGKIGLKFVVDPKTGVKLVGINARKGGVDRIYYERLDRERLQNEAGFKIFCLHIGLSEFKPPHMASMDTIPISYLPKDFDYYAGGHIHQRIEEKLPGYDRVVFPGPIFAGYPRDLEHTAKGESRGFYIVSVNDQDVLLNFVELFSPQAIVYCEMDVSGQNATTALSCIEVQLEQLEVTNKIVVLKIRGELAGGKTSEIKTWQLKNSLTANGAVFVDINKHGLSSREFDAKKRAGEDISTIEMNLLRENIGAVTVSIKQLQGEDGVKTAQTLLNALRVDVKANESKRDYVTRMIGEALTTLRLREVLS